MNRENEEIYYLYRHVRLDKNEVFYVGIGKIKQKYLNNYNEFTRYYRAFEKSRRSKHWTNIVNSTGYLVEIMMTSSCPMHIKTKEIEFISLYGRRDLGTGSLVNQTRGGDGALDISEERRDIQRQRAKKQHAIPGYTKAVSAKVRMSRLNNHRRQFYVYNIEGDFIGEFYNPSVAADSLGMPRQCMSSLLNGKVSSSNGKRISYTYLGETIPPYISKKGKYQRQSKK